MPPQTPPSTTSSLDPQAVNLAKSIRQVESGNNPQAKGKSGEFGSYQFLPSTWDAASKSVGINVPLEQATPEQQNEVAYKKIKAWKDQGLNVGQIASLWNSGKPDAYLDSNYKGTNSQGASYDVPAYAEKVANEYQKLKGSQSAEQPQEKENFDLLKTLEGAGLGALSWIGGHLKPIAGAGLIAGGGILGGLTEIPGASVAGEVAGGEVAKGLGLFDKEPKLNPEQVQKSSEASNSISDALSQQLSTTASNRNYAESKEGKAAIGTMGAYGYAPEVNEQGVIDFSASQQKSQQIEQDLVNLEKKLAGEGNISTLSAANYAGQYIAGDKNLTPQEREQVANLARKEVMSYSQSGRPFSLQDAIEARHQQYRATKGQYGYGKTSIQIAAHKAAAYGFREATRKATQNPELYEKILGEQKKHIGAQKLMERLHNKKAIQNKSLARDFLRGSARYAEIYIGDVLGGPLGAILGAMAGDKINRKIDKKLGKSIFETKEMRAALDILKDTKPEMYSHIKYELGRYAEHPDIDDSKVPKTKEGVIKDVKKDMKILSKEGLIKMKNRGVFDKPKLKPPQSKV